MVAPTGVSDFRAAVSESKGLMFCGLGKTGPAKLGDGPCSSATFTPARLRGVRAPVLVLRASRNARSNSRRLILTEDAGRFRIGCGRWLRANRRICICRPRTALRNLCTEAELDVLKGCRSYNCSFTGLCKPRSDLRAATAVR